MLLKEIKDIEFELLVIEKAKTNMDFNDYLKLEDNLDRIGKITDSYIKYIKEYATSITNESLKNQKKILEDKNNLLLETDIDIDLTVAKEIIEKYKV